MAHIIYTCSMHPEVRNSKPGYCPICGMKLEAETLLVVQHDSVKKEWIATGIALFIGVISFLLSTMFSGIMPALINLVLAVTVVFFLGLRYTTINFISSFKRFNVNMFTLIGGGVLIAFFYSLAVLIFNLFSIKISAYYFFDTAIAITAITMFGQTLEHTLNKNTKSDINTLINLFPQQINLIKADKDIQISIEKLKINDLVRIKAGQNIPADGLVVEGNAYVDESFLTGESDTIKKTQGKTVMAGATIVNGSIVVKVQKNPDKSYLADIISLTQKSQMSKIKIQSAADMASKIIIPIVFLVAVLVFIVWSITTHNYLTGLNYAISVVVIACPCALGLATPLAVSIGGSISTKKGILFRNSISIEKAKKIDVIVMDKTGTLTLGRPSIDEIYTPQDMGKHEFIAAIAAVERSSEHPLSKAILNYAKTHNIAIGDSTEFSQKNGLGVKATVNGLNVKIGNQKFIQIQDSNLLEQAEKHEKEGKTFVFADIDGKYGAVAIADTLRHDAHEVIHELKKMGIKIILASGDKKSTTQYIGNLLDIDDIRAEMMPEEKLALVKNLQKKGLTVAMIGDGINDTPALTRANLSIAIGRDIDLNAKNSDIILIHNQLKKLPMSIKIAKSIIQNIKQNLSFAVIYNLIALIVGTGILYPLFHIGFNPIYAAIAMAFSSVSVILNSTRLKKLNKMPS